MTDTNDARRRPGLWTRVRRWLFGDPESSPEPPRPTTPPPAPTQRVQQRHMVSEPVVVPAEGGVLTFTVYYELYYSSSAMSESKLAERIKDLHVSARSSMFGTIWGLARDVSPTAPGDAERAMNEALGHAWCYDDGTVSCRAVVRVVPDPRVLETQLPIWTQRVQRQAHVQMELERADQVDVLLTRWIELLRKFPETPLTIQAARLTDAELATVVDGLARRRKEVRQELADVLREAREAHSYVGMYEFATTYDRALRAFEKQVGLPGSVIPFGADSPGPDENGVRA